MERLRGDTYKLDSLGTSLAISSADQLFLPGCLGGRYVQSALYDFGASMANESASMVQCFRRRKRYNAFNSDTGTAQLAHIHETAPSRHFLGPSTRNGAHVEASELGP